MDPARMALPPVATALAGSLRSALASCTPEVQQRTRELLAGVVNSVFTSEGVAAPRHARTLPPAFEQFATRLKALGIESRSLGEVLRQLRAQIGERAMTPERTAALCEVVNARSGSGAAPAGGADHVARAEREYLDKLSPQQRAAYLLQQQASRQAEAAALLSGLEKLHSLKDIIQKIG